MNLTKSYIVYKTDYTDIEFHDLIHIQYDLPDFDDMLDEFGEVMEEFHPFFSDGASVEVNHENIRITEYGALITFLVESCDSHKRMDREIYEFIENDAVFQFAGDGDGLGFIVDLWSCIEDIMDGEQPTHSSQYWFDDYDI